MRVLADASITNIDQYFSDFFDLILYANASDLLAHIDSADILVCRSTLKVDESLLKSSMIKCVATASSGTDHIDKQNLMSKKIKLIDAHGVNAQAVCDYVLATLTFLKKEGYYLGKKVGIVGVGAVGSKLSSILDLLDFDVIGYDPLKDLHSTDFKTCDIEELYLADIICIHANLHTTLSNPSLNLFDSKLLRQLKPGVIIINAARGGIVNEQALLATDKIVYCTDVYLSEPNINRYIVDYATICTPHIAGHSIEAKINSSEKIIKDIYAEYAPAVPFLQSEIIKNNKSVKCYDFSLDSIKFQDFILGKYNPYYETQLMKLAEDKSKAFIELRNSHNIRYDDLDISELFPNLDCK